MNKIVKRILIGTGVGFVVYGVVTAIVEAVKLNEEDTCPEFYPEDFIDNYEKMLDEVPIYLVEEIRDNFKEIYKEFGDVSYESYDEDTKTVYFNSFDENCDKFMVYRYLDKLRWREVF